MKLIPIASNQSEVRFASGVTVLFSYQTPVACLIPGEGFYKTSRKWSRTTSKHITQWLQGANAMERDQEFFTALCDQ